MANWYSFITNNGDGDSPVLVNIDEVTGMAPATQSDGTEGLRIFGATGTIIARGSFQDMALVLDARIVDPS